MVSAPPKTVNVTSVGAALETAGEMTATAIAPAAATVAKSDLCIGGVLGEGESSDPPIL